MTYVLRRAHHSSGRMKCFFQMTLESPFFLLSYPSSLDLFPSCESVGGKTFFLCFLLTLNTELLTLPITECVVVFPTPSSSATQLGVQFSSILGLHGDNRSSDPTACWRDTKGKGAECWSFCCSEVRMPHPAGMFTNTEAVQILSFSFLWRLYYVDMID